MSNITIYHNPACGTSRNTLEMIRNSGNEPTVIHYLENPPSRDELVKLIADMGISVRALLRKKTSSLMKNWGLRKISLLTIS
uniref:Arsenate reductase glutaredoxin-coupled, glutaredoxin-like family n=1 Tax=Klebsiella pneumoniae TaxID=573 RepID=A0A8B0STC0_KLEPN|nr:Arsenate reductase glutaredoxin-coupled, glutaredoxin-like family [Klebsiella pneumoniae]